MPKWTISHNGLPSSIATPAKLAKIPKYSGALVYCVSNHSLYVYDISSGWRSVSTTASGPIVTLNGGTSVTIHVGDTWTDPGAVASDVPDGTITPVVTGTVNTATAGNYTLTYTATDSNGNTGSVTRTVVVALTVLSLPTVGTVTPADTTATVAVTGAASVQYVLATSSEGLATANATDATLSDGAFTLSGLTAETTYYYKVRAKGNGTSTDNSDWTAAASFTTTAAG